MRLKGQSGPQQQLKEEEEDAFLQAACNSSTSVSSEARCEVTGRVGGDASEGGDVAWSEVGLEEEIALALLGVKYIWCFAFCGLGI